MFFVSFEPGRRDLPRGFVNNFYHAQIMAGTIAVVVLALMLEGVLVLLERLLTPWMRGVRSS